MACNAKQCENAAIMNWNVFVRGYIGGKMPIKLCEHHSSQLYMENIRLKNGGQIDRVENPRNI